MRLSTSLGAAALSTGSSRLCSRAPRQHRTPPGASTSTGRPPSRRSLAVSEDFAAANPNWGFDVGEEGTGDGSTQFFCVDGADVADASRAINEDGTAMCGENSVETVELRDRRRRHRGHHVAREPGRCLNKYDLWALFGNESNAITTWQDAEAFAHEMGSTTDFPDGDIAITAPGTESGTYSSFIDLALASAAEERGVEPGTRDPVPPTYVGAANDNVIIQGVSQFPTWIGFVGLAYADNAGDAVKIVAVERAKAVSRPAPRRWPTGRMLWAGRSSSTPR